MTTETKTVKLKDIAYIFKHTAGNPVTVKPKDFFITRNTVTSEKPEKMLGVYVIRTSSKDVDTDYLRIDLQHKLKLPIMKPSLVNTNIKIPSLNKQRKLVRLTKNIDKMRKLEKQKIAQLTKFEKALFQNV